MYTRIRFPPELAKHQEGFYGLIGISALDSKVYVWQIDPESKGAKLIIWRVHPIVPESWEKVPMDISLPNFVRPHSHRPHFSLDYSLIAFQYNVQTPGFQTFDKEVLFIDIANQETAVVETFFDFNEMKPVVFGRSVNELFPSLAMPEIFKHDKRYKSTVAHTAQEIFYIAGHERTPTRQVCVYNLEDQTLIESPLCQFTALLHLSNSLIGSPEAMALTIYDFYSNAIVVGRMHVVDLHIMYSPVAMIPDVCVDPFSDGHRTACGDMKLAVIQGRTDCEHTVLTVLCLGVPSLKYLATAAVQKVFGAIGPDGEVVKGIGEEELCKMIGFQRKLF